MRRLSPIGCCHEFFSGIGQLFATLLGLAKGIHEEIYPQHPFYLSYTCLPLATRALVPVIPSRGSHLDTPYPAPLCTRGQVWRYTIPGYERLLSSGPVE